MLVGREAYRVAIPVAPREGLDRILRMCRVEWSAQDGTIANTQVRRAFKRLNRRAGALRTEGGVAARLHAASRVEHVVAQHDVLTRNVLLILAAAIIATHYAAVGRRELTTRLQRFVVAYTGQTMSRTPARIPRNCPRRRETRYRSGRSSPRRSPMPCAPPED